MSSLATGTDVRTSLAPGTAMQMPPSNKYKLIAMSWYLVKIIYQIICGNGEHTPQFDEQLRLVQAEDDLHAFQKARLIGEKEEDRFYNQHRKPVLWKFIDVCEIHRLDSLIDGAEIYSKISEEQNPETFIKTTRSRANHLLEKSLNDTIKLPEK